MNRCDSSTPLMEEKELDWNADFTDSSSGYASTDISDKDSQTWSSRDDLDSISWCSSDSLPSSHSNARSRSTCSSRDDLDSISSISSSRGDLTESDNEKVEPEMMNFSSQQALCNSLKYIMSMSDLCDVTFLVGASQVPVHGVRAILGTRSRVLYNLILQHQKESDIIQSPKTPKTPKLLRTPKSPKTPKKQQTSLQSGSLQRLTIPVRKYDPEVFHRIVQFVHCGTCSMDTDTAPGILCGAVQFGLRDLEKACWGFINRCIRQGHGDALLRPARGYSQHKVANKIISKIVDASNSYLNHLNTKLCKLSMESPM